MRSLRTTEAFHKTQSSTGRATRRTRRGTRRSALVVVILDGMAMVFLIVVTCRSWHFAHAVQELVFRLGQKRRSLLFCFLCIARRCLTTRHGRGTNPSEVVRGRWSVVLFGFVDAQVVICRRLAQFAEEVIIRAIVFSKRIAKEGNGGLGSIESSAAVGSIENSFH
jgi:hypothetical protein